MKEYTREEVKAGLESAIATVIFTKADGTLRQMRCTLHPERLPPVTGDFKVSGRKANDEVLSVFDLEMQDWRSFRIDSIERIIFEEVL